jgi:hypothetical protein
MRIIGGHDYYDSAMSFGHDPHTVYVRGNTTVPGDEMPEGFSLFPYRRPNGTYVDVPDFRPPRWELKSGKKNGYVYTRHYYSREWEDRFFSYCVVILAGQVYRGAMRVTTEDDKVIRHYFWTEESFRTYLEEEKIGIEFDSSYLPYFEPYSLNNRQREAVIANRWTILVPNPWSNGGHRAADWNIDQPILKSMQFYKAVPANICFQEIDMWVGGVLPKAGPPMAEVSDEIRAAKHGMDKTSFRKPKQGK